jgi:hypothetical protein
MDNNAMKTLHLILKHKWYDMTASGVKKEEYREIKPYYSNRFFNNDYTDAVLHRGYTNTTIRKKIAGITIGIGNPAWGAPAGEVYIIKWKDYEEEIETNTVCNPRP